MKVKSGFAVAAHVSAETTRRPRRSPPGFHGEPQGELFASRLCRVQRLVTDEAGNRFEEAAVNTVHIDGPRHAPGGYVDRDGGDVRIYTTWVLGTVKTAWSDTTMVLSPVAHS